MRRKETVKITESQLRRAVRESVASVISEKECRALPDSEFTDMVEEIISESLTASMLTELGMDKGKLSDKYGEVIGAVSDNLICLCLYPGSQAVAHWKSRIPALCERLLFMNLIPSRTNKPEYRFKILWKGVTETFDEDFGALLNRFKGIDGYYKARPNQHDRLTPVKPYKVCYEENRAWIEEALKAITEYVAKQDMEGLRSYVEGNGKC